MAETADDRSCDRDVVEVLRWVRPAIWCGWLGGIFALYVFVLPMPALYTGGLAYADRFPKSIAGGIYVACKPLLWLADRSEAYDRYLNWLADHFM